MSTPVVLVLIALAAYRVTRFVTADSLLDSLRARFFARHHPSVSPAGQWLECSWCSGWWITGALLALAHGLGLATWAWRYDLIVWWALAGVQGFLNAVDNRVTQ